MDTLPDLLASDLRLLSIGLNPSIPSVAAGFYFANPRNRFWKALNASELLQQPVDPGINAMCYLLEHERMGFTDLVKRPTRGAGDLKAADYRQAAPRLLELIQRVQPACAWFHGKLAFKHFVRYAGIDIGEEDAWGRQSCRLGKTMVFVTPNPSPANAVYSLPDLVRWYNELATAVAGSQTRAVNA